MTHSDFTFLHAHVVTRCQSRVRRMQRVESKKRRRDKFHAFCQMSSLAIFYSGRTKRETEMSLVYWLCCALSQRERYMDINSTEYYFKKEQEIPAVLVKELKVNRPLLILLAPDD